MAAIALLSYSFVALAQSADAVPQPSQVEVDQDWQPDPVQTFQDWQLKCEAEKKRCYIFQNTNLQETGQKVLGVVVGNLGPDGKYILHLVVPLGIYIPPGVAIKINLGDQIDIPVHTCTPVGCEATLDLKPELVFALESSTTVNVAFLDAVTRRQITVGVSMAGFRQANAALRRALSLQ